MDFLNYWDTRIDANERFFNNYPHIANFAFSECQELWDHMSADYSSLLARHNALVEAVAWERDCCQDIRPLFAWSGLYLRHGEGYVDGVAEDLRAIQDAARAEVDRLIASETSADCKGEG